MTSFTERLSPQAKQQYELFRRCHPMRMKLHEVRRSLDVGPTQTLLDVGAHNTMTSYYLRKLGGTWHSVIYNPAAGEVATELLHENVHLLKDQALPFEDKSFDVLVLLNFPTSDVSHEAVIAECHRVLKPDGRLVICVPHAKKWTLISPLRQLLSSGESNTHALDGYTETELFNALKDGFDVHGVRTYSRVFVEFVDVITRFVVSRYGSHTERDYAGVNRVYGVAQLFYAIAYQLDMLVFFTRGHCLIATAKRRAWRPRKTPVLSDGRSISEAVLTKTAD